MKKNPAPEKNPKQKMIKTSIDLTAEHYHFLKMKALDRKMKGEDPSFVTILRELIEEDRKKWGKIGKLLPIVIFCLLFCPILAQASWMPFNEAVNLKVGIGTSSVSNAGLTVMSGNVGIGTWNPGQALDVQGTVRDTGEIVNGNVGIGLSSPANPLEIQLAGYTGNVFQADTPASWDVSFSAKYGLNGVVAWGFDVLNSGTPYTNNLVLDRGSVGIGVAAGQNTMPATLSVSGGGYFSGNVGIGTTLISTSALTVMGGNVGIGTWVPGKTLDVNGTINVINVNFKAVSVGGTFTGNTITLTSTETQAIGDAVQIDSSGHAHLAKADVIANASAVALAVTSVSGSASNTYLLPGGTLKLTSSPSWTVGGLIYLSTTGTTGNTLTQTAPSATNNAVQVLGVAIAADTILFQPNLTQVEHS